MPRLFCFKKGDIANFSLNPALGSLKTREAVAAIMAKRRAKKGF